MIDTISMAVKKAIDVKDIEPFRTSILLTALHTIGKLAKTRTG